MALVSGTDRLDEGPTTGPVVQHGALKKVSVTGGPPIAIAQLTGASRGASWGSDDAIVFATSDTSTQRQVSITE